MFSERNELGETWFGSARMESAGEGWLLVYFGATTRSSVHVVGSGEADDHARNDPNSNHAPMAPMQFLLPQSISQPRRNSATVFQAWFPRRKLNVGTTERTIAIVSSKKVAKSLNIVCKSFYPTPLIRMSNTMTAVQNSGNVIIINSMRGGKE